jgi:hypothetical protein
MWSTAHHRRRYLVGRGRMVDKKMKEDYQYRW